MCQIIGFYVDLISKEFARAIVLECGRESGEANTLQGMRGIKKINISRGQPH